MKELQTGIRRLSTAIQKGVLLKKPILLKVCFLSSIFYLLALSGCATTSDFEVLQSRVANIQSEMIAQKKEIAEIKSSDLETSKEITILKERTEGVVKEQSINPIKESQSILLSQTSDLSKELQSLRGRFDENKYFIDRTIKDMITERELLQARITGLENELKEIRTKLASLSGSIERLEKKEQPSEPSKPKEVEPENKQSNASNVDPLKLYDEAQLEFKERNYLEAREKFEKFIKDFPEHSFAPNAYFWIGETYYADKKYEDAILAYEAFLKKYPSHEKTKGAMLKQAYSFIELGDKKTGRVLLEKVIERYPDSREAELAKKKIAEITSKATQGKKKK